MESHLSSLPLHSSGRGLGRKAGSEERVTGHKFMEERPQGCFKPARCPLPSEEHLPRSPDDRQSGLCAETAGHDQSHC